MSKGTTTKKDTKTNKEEKERKQKEQKEKQLKKEYDETLKNSVDTVISDVFENALEDGKSLEKVFNDLILNDYKYKQEIEEKILNEKITVEDWKTSPDWWEEIEISEPKFVNIYKFEDIEKNYIPTVKKLYNNYILKEKTCFKELEQELLNYFNTLKLQNNFCKIENIIHVSQKEDIKQGFCSEIAKDFSEYNYLYNNYNNILRKWYNQNKPIIKEKEAKATRTQPQKKESSGLLGALIGWWLGGK